MTDLREDEQRWLDKNPERCTACGHLMLFHYWEEGEPCLVADCECDHGEIPKRCPDCEAMAGYVHNRTCPQYEVRKLVRKKDCP